MRLSKTEFNRRELSTGRGAERRAVFGKCCKKYSDYVIINGRKFFRPDFRSVGFWEAFLKQVKGVSMRALGIDPGTGRCGFGVVDKDGGRISAVDYGIIETFPDKPASERLRIIYTGVSQLIDAYHPDVMGVETLYFNRNITTAIAVAQARGVILLAGCQKGVPLFECTPLQVKQQVVGYGRAEKKQVIAMTMNIMHITEKIDPDDAADALAIGLTAIYRTEHDSIYRRMK